MTLYLYPLISLKEAVDEKVGVRLAHSTSLAQGCPSQLGLLGQRRPPPLQATCFSPKGTAFAARSPLEPSEGLCFPIRRAHRLLGEEAFCYPISSGWIIIQLGKLWQVPEEIFLMHRRATILTVCVWTTKYSGFSLSPGFIFIPSSWKDILLILSSEKN